MVLAKAKGFGKIILFGEHFVVYGLPGIASGIDKYVEVEIEKIKASTDVIFDDKVFKEKFSIKEQPEHVKTKMLNAMFEKEQFVKLEGLKITINSNMPYGAGLGYSAALAVAIARAMNQLFDLLWKDEQINEAAHKSEQIIHGNPSGIDTACATYDSVIWFEKDLEKKKDSVRRLKCGKSLQCLLVDTGIKHHAKETIELVQKYKEKNSKKFDVMCADYKKLAGKAKQEIQYGGVNELGKLMNQNHLMLKEIGLSTKEIDEIVKVAIYDGALGAKITGAGMGGNVLILCYNEAQQEKLISAYAGRNYKAMKVKIN